MKLEDDRDHCHKCDRVTAWRKPRRTSKILRCEGCRDVFPCRRITCGHADCEAARKAVA